MKRTPLLPNIENWNLEHRGEELYWNGCNVIHLAQKYGTPLYVVNKHLLEESLQGMIDAFRAEDLDAHIFFSFKTNPVPEVLKTIIKLGAGAEVISEFEFWLSRKLGLEGSKIIVNGCIKSPELLKQAVESDVALINVETVSQLSTLRDITRELGRKVNVGLRINPALRKRRFDLTSATGSSTSHMGFLPDSSELSMALNTLQEEPQLKFRAFHFHIGSGIRSLRPYKEALPKVLKVWEGVLSHGFTPEILDIGGGFTIPTLKELNLWEAVRLFGWGKTRPPRLEKRQNDLLRGIAQLCSQKLQSFSRKYGIPMPEVYVEPGRALTARSQLLLLTVHEMIKRGKAGPFFALCDGGAMSLSPLFLSEYHTVMVANRASQGRLRKYNILGNLPTPLDVVALRRDMPEILPGDVLAVMDVGAYFTSLGNNFAGPRPAIVEIENGSATLIRRRETFEDLISRDERFSL